MRAVTKRERVPGQDNRTEKLRVVKRERLADGGVDAANDAEPTKDQDPACRRVIRSQYLALMHLINEKKDDLVRRDSDKFDKIMNEVEKLHEQVQKPREQVADAEALLDLAKSLVGSAKSLLNEGVTPSEFVSCLLNEFGQSSRGQSSQDGAQNSINWKSIGLAVSPIFMKVNGCCTMFGPMENELKQRKTAGQRKRAEPTERARPEELAEAVAEEKTDTDKNMATMFDILRRNKRVRLESLMLNRNSFAQTVENLFALSFLVKDGRVAITVDENGLHSVSPKNAPAANAVMAKEVSYSHFMFRFDYKDWKLMKDMVPDGGELMPHRYQFCTNVDSQVEMGASQPATVATPIRKLSRNRGRVVQEEVVDKSPDCDEANASRAAGVRRCKRKINLG